MWINLLQHRYSVNFKIVFFLFLIPLYIFGVGICENALFSQASEIENREKLKQCNKKLDDCQNECMRLYPHRRDFRQGKCRDYCILEYKDKCDSPVYIKSNRI